MKILLIVLLCYYTSAQSYVSVPTSRGPVKGIRVDYGNDKKSTYYGSAEAYLGIPYAQPPTGDNRFRAPRSINNYGNDYDATYYRPKCPQANTGSSTNEDCLYLNVFTQQSGNATARMAVMVFIDGGNGLTEGGNDQTQMKGVVRNLVTRGVVVVTLQYRLGALGFFSMQAADFQANNGMLDQVMALRWVQTEIGNFGGDPNRVTLAGHGDGACAVSAHTLSPASKNLFQQAILSSGTIQSCYSADGTTSSFSNQPVAVNMMQTLQYNPGVQYSPLNGFAQNYTNEQAYSSQNPTTTTPMPVLRDTSSNGFINPSQDLAQALCNVTAQQWQSGQVGNLRECLSRYSVDIIVQTQASRQASWLIVRDNTFMPDTPENLSNRRQAIPIIIGTVQDEDAHYAFKMISEGHAQDSQSDMFNAWMLDYAHKNKLNQTTAQQISGIIAPNYQIRQTNTSYYDAGPYQSSVGNANAVGTNYRNPTIGAGNADGTQINYNYGQPNAYGNPIIGGGNTDGTRNNYNNGQPNTYGNPTIGGGNADGTQNFNSNQQNVYGNPIIGGGNTDGTRNNYNNGQPNAYGNPTIGGGNADGTQNNYYNNGQPNGYGNPTIGGGNADGTRNNYNNGQPNGYGNPTIGGGNADGTRNNYNNGQPNGYGNPTIGGGNADGTQNNYNNGQPNAYRNPPIGSGNTGYNAPSQYQPVGGYQYEQFTPSTSQPTTIRPQTNTKISHVQDMESVQSLKTISTVSADSGIVSYTATEVDSYIRNGAQYVHIYQFTYMSKLGISKDQPTMNGWQPVSKGQDQIFIMMNEAVWASGKPSKGDRQMADQMGERWTQFAKEGTINNWQPAAGNSNYNYCNLQSNPVVENGYGQKARTVFNDQVNPIVQQAKQDQQNLQQRQQPNQQYPQQMPGYTPQQDQSMQQYQPTYQQQFPQQFPQQYNPQQQQYQQSIPQQQQQQQQQYQYQPVMYDQFGGRNVGNATYSQNGQTSTLRVTFNLQDLFLPTAPNG